MSNELRNTLNADEALAGEQQAGDATSTQQQQDSSQGEETHSQHAMNTASETANQAQTQTQAQHDSQVHTIPVQQIQYDEHGNAFLGKTKYYAQQSLDELVEVQKNENRRLAFQNKMLADGVDAQMAQSLSQSLELNKLDNFDYSNFVGQQTRAQKVAGTPAGTPASGKEETEKSSFDYGLEYLNSLK